MFTSISYGCNGDYCEVKGFDIRLVESEFLDLVDSDPVLVALVFQVVIS